MKFKLKDGRVVDVILLNAGISVKALQSYINEIIAEKAYIMMNKKATYSEEKKWKQDSLAGMKKGQKIHLIALSGKRVIASFGANRGMWNESCNVSIGASVAKDFRHGGLGEFMLRTLVKKAKQKFKPKNVYLSVLGPNKPARRLYEKVGFRKMAVFPKWIKHEGKYIDEIWMRLKS
ncbi:MAG: GNAT family N-acetyltransferase [Candidatus Micrarchaeota archaeon]